MSWALKMSRVYTREIESQLAYRVISVHEVTEVKQRGHVGGDTGTGGSGSCVQSIWVRLRDISASGSQRQKGRQVIGLENTDFYK